MVTRTDDGCVIGVASNRREKLVHGLCKSGAESCLGAARQQHIVRRNTGLAGVKQLAVGDPDCGFLKIARSVDHTRGFSAKLQRGGRQVGRSGLRHHTTNSGRAGKKQVVKRQRAKCCGKRRVPLHHAQFAGRKSPANQLIQQRRCSWRQLAGLEHDAVACTQSGDHRGQRQLHRIVPRRHYPHHTQWLTLNVSTRGLKIQRRAHLDRLHPLRQRLEGA